MSFRWPGTNFDRTSIPPLLCENPNGAKAIEEAWPDKKSPRADLAVGIYVEAFSAKNQVSNEKRESELSRKLAYPLFAGEVKNIKRPISEAEQSGVNGSRMSRLKRKLKALAAGTY